MQFQKVQQGFTLIELMIVVAIIGILSAIAIPSYTSYTAKAQASEAFTLLDGLKTPVAQGIGELQFASGCSPTLNPYLNGITSSGQYVTSIGFSGTSPNCAVTATFKTSNVSNILAGNTVVFTFNSNNNSWTCTTTGSTSGMLPPSVKPASCQ
jgi:type IV pilus assembly protein PilA